MEPIIFGSGLTAALAACIFKESRIITDKVKEPHKAVLRFRSNDISKVTGIPFKKVTVYKDIYSEEPERHIKCMNSYSKKVTGGLYDRSIADLSPVTRWIAPLDFHEQIMQVCNMENRLEIDSNYHIISASSNRPPVINTFPLHEFANIDMPKGASSSIYVSRFEIPSCDLYQTVYFPDFSTNIYRITIEGSTAIVEAIAPVSAMECDRMLWDAMHIEPMGSLELNYEQKIGKMIEIDDDVRRMEIANLTSEYNIYSLGRVACWRPKVLLDDCLQDIYKIRDMINLHPYDRAMKWK